MCSHVDAVITWVDGDDPLHKAKLECYLQSIGGGRPSSASPTRFSDAGELEYCVVSLLRFAPWVRTIFIVTDAQTPKFMEKFVGTIYENKIKIVDHKEIFVGFESFLPTFNSSSILSVLHKIPELSENFLFLNDDFFLIRPVVAEDFFINDKVVLRGKWRLLSDYVWHKVLRKFLKGLFSGFKKRSRPIRAGFIAGQELSAKILGFKYRYFELSHHPHAWRVSTHVNYFKRNPELLVNNVKHRLRSPEQYIGESLAAHLEVINGSAVVDNRLKNLYIKAPSHSVGYIKFLFWLARFDSRYAFACVQSLDLGEPKKQRLIFDWLDNTVGRIDNLLLKDGHE